MIKFHVKHNQVHGRGGGGVHKVCGLIGLELWLPWHLDTYKKKMKNFKSLF